MKTLVRSATLAALGVLLLVSGLAVRDALAHEPHPGLQFSIGVPSVPGCNTRASDVACTLPASQPFVVEVSLDGLPDDIPSYDGYDIYLEYAGLTPQQDASTDEWPECGFPASSYNTPGVVLFGCARGVPPAGPSSYVGPIGTNTFTCNQSGSISLIHGQPVVQGNQQSDTVLYESLDAKHAEGTGTSEKLTINCGSVPAQTPGIVTGGTPGPIGPPTGEAHPDITGPTSTAPPPGQTLEPTAAAKATTSAKVKATATARAKVTPDSGGGGDNGSSKTWVWIVITVAGVAAVVVAGGGYWYVRNRGGGTPPAGGSAT